MGITSSKSDKNVAEETNKDNTTSKTSAGSAVVSSSNENQGETAARTEETGAENSKKDTPLNRVVFAHRVGLFLQTKGKTPETGLKGFSETSTTAWEASLCTLNERVHVRFLQHIVYGQEDKAKAILDKFKPRFGALSWRTGTSDQTLYKHLCALMPFRFHAMRLSPKAVPTSVIYLEHWRSYEPNIVGDGYLDTLC